MFVGFGLVGWILLAQFGSSTSAGLLLQIYWLLNLPALGYECVAHSPGRTPGTSGIGR